MVMSSDKITNIRQPLCTVEFELETENGRTMKSIEMDKEELKKFMNALEAANKSVVQLRTT